MIMCSKLFILLEIQIVQSGHIQYSSIDCKKKNAYSISFITIDNRCALSELKNKTFNVIIKHQLIFFFI